MSLEVLGSKINWLRIVSESSLQYWVFVRELNHLTLLLSACALKTSTSVEKKDAMHYKQVHVFLKVSKLFKRLTITVGAQNVPHLL
jgi:hypothetical protein